MMAMEPDEIGLDAWRGETVFASHIVWDRPGVQPFLLPVQVHPLRRFSGCSCPQEPPEV